MSAINIVFPKTDIVAVKFVYRQNRQTPSVQYDDKDRMKEEYAREAKEYFYKLPSNLVDKVQIGQPVLVHCATGYQVAEISGLNRVLPEIVNDEKVAMVICTVDLNAYYAEIERKQQLIAMRQQIEATRQEIEKSSIYELLAEKNPEFKELLDAFKELGGKL